MQTGLFTDIDDVSGIRPKGSLLKWVGSKYRYAEQIASNVPSPFGTFFESFLGSGAVTATVQPTCGFASDVFEPVIDIWIAVRDEPETVCQWYEDRIERYSSGDRKAVYNDIRASFNQNHNAADFLFLCRACYAGIIRFRKTDGHMSTPIGPHNPISPDAFAKRVREWHHRLRGVAFETADYRQAFSRAVEGDVIYCDTPYFDSQRILYGAQSFHVDTLIHEIAQAKERGVRVLLSIDGSKKSGDKRLAFTCPPELFETEIRIDCGRSMLRRLQMRDQTLEAEHVADRLLLTF